MPTTKRFMDNSDSGRPDTTDEELTPTKIARSEPIGLKEVVEEGYISWVIFRVESAQPVKLFQRPGSSNKSGRVYKFLFSDGVSCSMEGIAYDDIGESIAKQLKVDQVYSVKGKIKVEKRDPNWISEANSHFSLKFSQKVTVNAEKKYNWKPFRMRIQQVKERMHRDDEKFLSRLNGVTFEEGTLYRYFGCTLCKTSIRFRNPDDGKFYCSSNYDSCKNDKTERQRKLFMIIKNCIFKEDENEEGLHDVVIFDDNCEYLLGKRADELGEDDNIAQNYVNKTLPGAKLDIQIKVIKDPNSHYNVTLDKILSKKMPTASVLPLENSETENEDDAEPFELGSGADESLEEEVPNLVELNVPVLTGNGETSKDKICVYDLTSNPQALVLLINNHNFQNKYGNPEPPRRGSETDVLNVKDTFTKLGCEIFEGGCFDIKLEDLKSILQRFKAEVVGRKISSLFVVVMSHGNTQEVQMVDGTTVNMWTDIVYTFNDTNFPQYIGNPKIFIFQTCQTFPLTTHSSFIRPQNGTTSDILVALPNIPGYTAKRNKRGLGSWYIYYLMEVLREKASTTELVDMLTEVQKRLKAKTESVLASKNISSGIALNSQVSTWKPILFNKFNFKVPTQATEAPGCRNDINESMDC